MFKSEREGGRERGEKKWREIKRRSTKTMCKVLFLRCVVGVIKSPFYNEIIKKTIHTKSNLIHAVHVCKWLLSGLCVFF